MLTLKLRRLGRKNRPFFRIIVVDKRKHPKKGVAVDEVGYYDPIKKDVNVDKERVLDWIKKGVQPSATCYNLFVKLGIIKGKKIHKHKKKKVKEGEQAQKQGQQEVKTQGQNQAQAQENKAQENKESQQNTQTA